MKNSWNLGLSSLLQVLLWGACGLLIVPAALVATGWVATGVGVGLVSLGHMLELAPALDAEVDRRSRR